MKNDLACIISVKIMPYFITNIRVVPLFITPVVNLLHVYNLVTYGLNTGMLGKQIFFIACELFNIFL